MSNDISYATALGALLNRVVTNEAGIQVLMEYLAVLIARQEGRDPDEIGAEMTARWQVLRRELIDAMRAELGLEPHRHEGGPA